MKNYVMTALFAGCTMALALTIGLDEAKAGAASNGIEKIGKISGGQQLPKPSARSCEKIGDWIKCEELVNCRTDHAASMSLCDLEVTWVQDIPGLD